VGSIPFNVQAKVECNKDLAIVIWKTRVGYAKALGMNITKRVCPCRLCGARRLTFLHSTMNQLVISNNAILNLIFIFGFWFHIPYLLFCVVCFRVWNITREMFVANVV
jgi:hypothetical protein